MLINHTSSHNRPATPKQYEYRSASVKRVILEQEEKLKKECTFAPKINKKSSSMAKTSPEERLTTLAQSMRTEHIRREKERAQREIEEQEKFSFQPNTLKRPVSTEKPQDKARKLQREKRERLRDLEKKLFLDDPDHTFTPNVCEGTLKIMKKNKEALNVFDRNQFRMNQKRSNYQADLVVRQQEKECTFQPAVNSNSDKILRKSKLFNTKYNNFFERQEVMQIREEKNKMEIKEKENVDVTKLFKPHVNKTSKMLAKYLRPGETVEDMILRLSEGDHKKRLAVQEMLNEEYYGQFKFQPTINPISKQIGQATDEKELVENERSKRAKQQIAEDLEEEWKRTYSFKPKLVATTYQAQDSKYKLIDPKNPDNIVDNVKRYKAEKETRLAETKKILEDEEMKPCTFQPNTQPRPKTPTQPKGPVIIRGLGKHLERRDRAKKLEEEKREREEKVFRPRVKGQGTKLPFTIPVPFKNLHPDNYGNQRQIKHLDLVQKYYEQEQKQFSFTPKTNIANSLV